MLTRTWKARLQTAEKLCRFKKARVLRQEFHSEIQKVYILVKMSVTHHQSALLSGDIGMKYTCC